MATRAGQWGKPGRVRIRVVKGRGAAGASEPVQPAETQAQSQLGSFENHFRLPTEPTKPARAISQSNCLNQREKSKWVPFRQGEQPQRKPAVRETFRAFPPSPRCTAVREKRPNSSASQGRSLGRESVTQRRLGGASSQERTVLPDRQGRYREMMRNRDRREGAERRPAARFRTVPGQMAVWEQGTNRERPAAWT